VAALAVAGAGAWAVLDRGAGGGAAAPGAATSPTASASPSLGASPVATPSARPSPQMALIPLPPRVGRFVAAAAPRLVAGPRRKLVPILMYHLIGTPRSGVPYPDLFVSTADFAAQMRYLEAHGFTAVTLTQLAAFWRGAGELPARPVVLTFDDGYRSDWRVAAPILQRIGWPGVLDLCLNAVRPHGDLPTPLVHGLVRAGWEIDDHTLTHHDLTTLDAAGRHREIVVSRAVLRALTGQPVSFFCYPAGRYDAAVIAVVKAAGFTGATTTNEGLAASRDLFTLARIRVHRDMSLANFAKALAP